MIKKITAILFLMTVLFNLNSYGQLQKAGEDLFIYNETEVHNCSDNIKFNPKIHINSPASLADVYPNFIWPLEDGIDTNLVLVNYVDDQSGSAIKDYMGNDWSYNGHNGTDISLHNFRAMDRFFSVKAAAPGIVDEIAFTNYDRDTACITDPNYVLIRHEDGSYAYYYHLMKNSIIVKVGEYVPAGRTIGYVGSSGCSSDAHLHFEPGRFINGTWSKRDPWHGTFNTLPSCWQNQYSYIREREFKIHNMGVFTEGLVGNFNNLSTAMMKQGILQPNTVSGYESKIGIFILFQGKYTGKQVKYEIRKPDGTLFASTYFYVNEYNRYSWSWWTANFNPGIDDAGQWFARIVYDNVEQMRDYFNVQLLTSNRPRLYPVAGKCFRRSLFVQRDTLRVRPVRSNMQYGLINAPSNVTITNDSILNINPAFTQTLRTDEFKVIASIGGSLTLRDTLIYKLIDTTKNNFTGNGIVSLELTSMTEGLWNGSSMVNDSINVILRGSLSPYGRVDSSKFRLNSNGFGIANFLNANGGIYYYIVLKHRNSIETWSKNVQMMNSGQPNTYNFTILSTQAYGNNLKFKSGKWCMYSGDINQDGVIDATDFSIVDNDISFFSQGYVVSDIDGDNFVDGADMAYVDNNAGNFVISIRP